MIGVVITGHIKFASGLQSALNAIAGEMEGVRFVDFTEDLDPVALETKLLESAKEVDEGEGVLFLTDLFGGTPNNCCVRILMQNENYEVISGTNLSMAITACLERDDVTLAELVEAVQLPETTQIRNMRVELANLNAEEPADDADGI